MERNSSFFWNTDSFGEDEDEIDLAGEGESSPIIGLILEEEETTTAGHRGGDCDNIVTPPSAAGATDQSPLLSSLVQPNRHYNSYSSTNNPKPVVHYSSSSPPALSTSAARRGSSSTMMMIRFQVVLWYVGAVDVVLGQVPVRFRVTLFWNDYHHHHHHHDASSQTTMRPSETRHHRAPAGDWKMEGRMLAYHRDEQSSQEPYSRIPIHVPPLSILNAVNHEIIGSPEVTMLREDTRLMRWTCMYSATLFQGENLRVDHFPHDQHDLVLRLGVLAHRRPGGIWDQRKWALGLATEEDSQGSTRIPHGLLVDHVTVPNFNIVNHELDFEFVPLPMGSGDRRNKEDRCLQVKLTVFRESRHYDTNIVPLLGVLNVVAISCLPRNFASATASTETMLSIAFVEIGIRLTIDSHLPGVGYQIKVQRVMNRCFWLLCFLVLESNANFFLVKKMGWKISTTDWIDLVVAIGGLIYTVDILLGYYGRLRGGVTRIPHGAAQKR